MHIDVLTLEDGSIP